jgi:hypothetical protein
MLHSNEAFGMQHGISHLVKIFIIAKKQRIPLPEERPYHTALSYNQQS